MSTDKTKRTEEKQSVNKDKGAMAQSLNKKSQYVCNKHNSPRKVCAYDIYARVDEVSEIERVRFLDEVFSMYFMSTFSYFP